MTTHYPSASLSRLPSPIPKARISSAYRERKPAGVLKSNQTFISAAHLDFAQALSQNGIAWLYKPRTFAIEWTCTAVWSIVSRRISICLITVNSSGWLP